MFEFLKNFGSAVAIKWSSINQIKPMAMQIFSTNKYIFAEELKQSSK